MQTGDLPYNNSFHNGSAIYNREKKSKINSDFTSSSVASNLQCPFIDSSSEQEDLSDHHHYHPDTEVNTGYLVMSDYHEATLAKYSR